MEPGREGIGNHSFEFSEDVRRVFEDSPQPSDIPREDSQAASRDDAMGRSQGQSGSSKTSHSHRGKEVWLGFVIQIFGRGF
jgi:hypothetical protein